MKILQNSIGIKRVTAGLILVCLTLLSQARQLVVSNNGEVQYILQEHQLINIDLVDGTNHKGMLTIVSDSTFNINGVTVSIDQVARIKVKEGSRVGKGVGVAGLVGGTGLAAVGLSLLAQDDGLIVDLVNLIIAIPLIAVGVVIDAISITALAFSGGKWITVSGDYAKYRLSIV